MTEKIVMRVLLVLIVLGCTIGVIVSRAERAPYTIRIAFLASRDDEDYLGAVAFRDAVQKATRRKVDIQIYPSGQFCGSERECIEALQSGILEVHQTTVGGLAGLYPAAQVFDLPYLFNDDAIAECVLDGPVVAAMGEEILALRLGMRLMAIGNTGGWRTIATTRQRVRSVADLKGLRIRTLPSALEQQMVRELGASPVPLPFSELYSALGAGLLDGTKNSVQDVVGMKLNDHIQHLLVDRHAYMAAIWWYSEAQWRNLPLDMQDAVRAGFRALAIETRRAAKAGEAPAFAEFKRRGGTVDVVTAVQREELRAATADLRRWYSERYGDKWLPRVDAALTACELHENKGSSP